MNKFKKESEIYEFWEKEKLFSADPNSNKKKYSLLIPPPNLTGELHLGHAMQHSILDAVARFRRLQGFDVLLLPGVDHAGIQFESTFDKHLAKQGLSKQKLGREKWLELAWKFKDEIYKSLSGSWRMMGLSADWSREVFTLEEKCQRAVFEEFKTYYDAGLIYKGPYIVQWCPRDRTAIEDVEVEYEERKEKLYYLKYGPLTLATVRPETKFGDTAMAVNPKDKRYKDYVGKEFEIETLNGKKKMRVVADDVVDPDFGTGVIKVTPGHDFIDYEIGKRHNLPIINVINKEGRLTDAAGKYAGMKVTEAREAMIPELKEKGILVKEEDYVHNVAVCERCKSVVEPIISEEWFVKVEEIAKEAIQLINKDAIKFLPGNYKKILIEWLKGIHDWCISRSLWWGHRIPVWYRGKEIKVSLKSPGVGWKQDEQVLDTWFSSGLWPLSTLGWLNKVESGKLKVENLLDRYFPWDFEISAPEIKFLWIARMIMISNYFTKMEPFKTMFFHGMLRDLQGRKFSKSLGNGIEPGYLIGQWGVDATRMALYTYSIPGRDGRVSKQTLDERGKNFRNFATKIRNIARFVIELRTTDNRLPTTDNRHKDDIWIQDKLERLVARVTKNLESLELHLAVEDIYNFVWHDFADKYIEKSKTSREEAQATLEYVLKQVMIILHPFMPFLTEEIYQQFDVHRKSIMLEKWPL
ncbi:valine--tRNA ligase [Candidatus Curtissbacteria bacterium RIFCSPHIGHO2_01_FULL_41_11]|uniref:Valine--tRNA ligase n=1 Tax=Candidatus Curtissbacteria bacterium RIFCSPHIGHO2_01_FULL_41_11 TaxID=1797711 RepID=A0A1F5G6P9_9BACT|nr:MAG: valine--tRNA ligase [Candidatus Curtissbacteria bacterium RIFCSPHIGHO2_01_FULL_41_11]